MYTTKDWQFWVFMISSWFSFPALCVWLMVTHPGKCAKAWKMEITDTWFNKIGIECDGCDYNGGLKVRCTIPSLTPCPKEDNQD